MPFGCSQTNVEHLTLAFEPSNEMFDFQMDISPLESLSRLKTVHFRGIRDNPLSFRVPPDCRGQQSIHKEVGGLQHTELGGVRVPPALTNNLTRVVINVDGNWGDEAYPEMTKLDLSGLSVCTVLEMLEVNLSCDFFFSDAFPGDLVVSGLEKLPASCACVVLVPFHRPPRAGLPFVQVAPVWELVLLDGPRGIAHYRRIQVQT